MNDDPEKCPSCGDEMVALARLRLCRGCDAAWLAIAGGPTEYTTADRQSIVRNAIEAFDNWLDDMNRIIRERDRNTAQLLAQRDAILADYEEMREQRNSYQRISQCLQAEDARTTTQEDAR